MSESKFLIGDALRFGWRVWKENWPLFSVATLVYLLLPAIPHALQYSMPENAIFLRVLIGLVYFILLAIAQMGILNVTLKAAKGDSDVTINDFFSTVHLFPSFLGGSILYYLAVFFGLILLIIPGIIFGLKFCLWPYYVLEREYLAVDSLKASNVAVYGSKWKLFLFAIVGCLINLLGVFFFGIGLLISIPVVLLAWAYIYLRLQEAKETRGEVEWHQKD